MPRSANCRDNGNQVAEEILNGKRQALYGWDGQGLATRVDAFGHSLFYLYDGLGSVIALMDEDGRLVQNYEYSAYGENLSGKDSVNAFRFVGRFGGMQDDDTGLTYFWNRWYDSKTGRWVSEDPIRQEGGVNLYGYVGNGPTNNADSKGLTLESNWNFFWDWVGNGGNKSRHYGQNDLETSEMKSCTKINEVRAEYKQKACPKTMPFESRIWESFKKSINRIWSTEFQVGSFVGRIEKQGDCTIKFHLENTASIKSFFYHLPGLPDPSETDRDNYGHMGNIYQTWDWEEVNPCLSRMTP